MTPWVEWDEHVRAEEIAKAVERERAAAEVVHERERMRFPGYHWRFLHSTVTNTDLRHEDPRWPRRPHLLDVLESKMREARRQMFDLLDREVFYPSYRSAFENGGCRQ